MHNRVNLHISARWSTEMLPEEGFVRNLGIYKHLQTPRKIPELLRNIVGTFCPTIGNIGVISVQYQLPLSFVNLLMFSQVGNCRDMENYFDGSSVEEWLENTELGFHNAFSVASCASFFFILQIHSWYHDLVPTAMWTSNLILIIKAKKLHYFSNLFW